MKKLLLLLLLLPLTTQLSFAQQPPTTVPARSTMGPKLLVLKMHGDWCEKCKAMGPIFENLTKELAEKPILFEKFDLTDKGTKNQAIQLASALGIIQVARENQATGFILIVDPSTKTVLQKLTKDDSLETMKQAILSRL